MVLIIPIGARADFSFAHSYSLVSNILSSEQASAKVIPNKVSLNDSVLVAFGSNNPNMKESLMDNDISIVGGSSLLAEAGPLGKVADSVSSSLATSDQISVYIVREGDTLSGIAKLFNVSVNTILWANDLKNNSIVHEGDTLVILPISGLQYTVKKGDTLDSIVKKYGGDKGEIMVFNNLDSEFLKIGDLVVIPNGEAGVSIQTKKTTVSSAKIQSPQANYAGYYTRPIVGGRRSQGLHGHNAIDIAAPAGTPILAMASGKVILVREGGYNGGYGNYAVIKHPNGTQTLYAHALYFSVSVGQTVTKGEVIGAVGSTGHSTGNHLHFEIRGAKNPF